MIHSKIKSTIKNQEGIDKFMQMIAKYPRAYVTIGVHQDAGKYTNGKNPPDVVQVALWNEFGTKNIPQRSFVRSTADEQRAEIEKTRNRIMDDILNNKLTIEEGLAELGFKIQVLIQNKIKSGVPPANALSTTRQKQGAGVIAKSKRVTSKEYNFNYKGTGKIARGKYKNLKGKSAAQAMMKQGKTSTLVNTGLLLRSISFKVYLK